MRTYKFYILLGLLLFGFTGIQAQVIGLSVPDLSGVQNENISVPVRVDSSLSGLNATAYQLQIVFSTYYLEYLGTDISGTLTENMGEFTSNLGSDNRITIAAAGDTPLSGTGVLVYLQFRLLKNGGSWINFDYPENNFFNQGEFEMAFDNGYLSISAAPVITVSPNTQVLTSGEQLQFSVSGGVGPFNWQLTNPAVASIDASGLLTGIAAGFTRVIATDQTGVIDTTNGEIEVRAFKLSLPDSAFYQGYTFDLPVSCSSLTGLDITSGSFDLTYSETLLEPISVETGGTLLASYASPEFHFSAGKLTIAFAGDLPINGAGTLLYVRFKASLDNYGGSYINFNQILFNETLRATDRRGYCNIKKLPDLVITPNEGTLIVGQTLQLSASGGELPYSWSVSDPSLASISSDGLLNALSGGTVYIRIQDMIGATGTSRAIEIYDTELTIPDTVAQIGSGFDLPLFLSDVPVGGPVFSVQTTITIDTSIIKNIQASNSGTLSEAWSVAGNLSGNSYSVALAGTTPVTSSGILFKLHFDIDPAATDGHRSNFRFTELVLNEGSPRALAQDGVLTTLITGIDDHKPVFLPRNMVLKQNFPNPFNPSTRIDFSLSIGAEIELSIFDIVGKHIRNLGNGFYNPGSYSLVWDGKDAQGNLVSSGIYFYQMKAGDNFQKIRKMIFQK